LKNIMVCEPLELEYLAGAIEKKHEVEILDLILENILEKKIKQFKPDILGTSSYITGVNEVKSICERSKNVDSKIITVVGGVHASLNPHDYESKSIDHIIRGEGLKQFNALIDALEQNKTFTPGIYSNTKDFLAIDIENLPLPRRELVVKYQKKYYYLFHQPVTIIKTTFGCPFKCNFCYCRALTDDKVYSRSPENILRELQEIISKDVYIIDDTFFVSKKHVMDIHALIVKNNIKKEYLVYGHSDFIINNPDVIKAWAEIGLKACIIGLESPKDSELKSFNKVSTVDKNREAIKILQHYNIDVYASFIVDPAWTLQDFKTLDRFIKENKLFYIVIQPLTPIPGTSVFKEEDDYIIPRKYYELWDMQHSVLNPLLGEKRFYKEIRKIYIKTIFNPFRTTSLKLNTAPTVFSLKYFRLIKGALGIYFDLRKASKHKNFIDKTNALNKNL
jgi:hopanoid C-3 methylase